MESSHQLNQPQKRIFLWTSTRCVSTALARSIRELPRVKVMIDPHVNTFEFNGGPGERSEKSDPRQILLKDTRAFDDQYKEIDKKLLDAYDGFDAVFCKTMAYFVEDRYEDYIQGPFTHFKHTFIIRHPEKSTISHYKACKNSNTHFYYPGFRQLYEMYEVVRRTDPNPFVVDADDLLDNPKGMLQLYCSATGLPFTEDMLTWEPEEGEEWKHFPNSLIWYRTAMYSSGFMKTTQSTSELLSDYPEIVKECIQYSLPYYEALYERRARLQSTYTSKSTQ